LWELDTSLGMSAGQLLATRFRLLQRPGARSGSIDGSLPVEQPA